MERNLSTSLSAIANFMADRRGIPLIIGFFLVLLNFIFQFIPTLGWFVEHDVLLHLGLLLSIAGMLLSSAL